MSNALSLTGSDTIQINDRVLTTFGNEDIMNVDFPDDIVNLAIGKDGNMAAAANASGRRAEIKLRLLRGSVDDKFLNTLLRQQLADLASFNAMTVKLVKRMGDGFGNITNDTYFGTRLLFKKIPGAVSNAAGNPEQSMVMWEFHCGKMIRPIL